MSQLEPDIDPQGTQEEIYKRTHLKMHDELIGCCGLDGVRLDGMRSMYEELDMSPVDNKTPDAYVITKNTLTLVECTISE